MYHLRNGVKLHVLVNKNYRPNLPIFRFRSVPFSVPRSATPLKTNLEVKIKTFPKSLPARRNKTISLETCIKIYKRIIIIFFCCSLTHQLNKIISGKYQITVLKFKSGKVLNYICVSITSRLGDDPLHYPYSRE